jgi:hypothetical protein
MTHYRSKRSQAGEGELYVFGALVAVCCLISAVVFGFNWFKDTKDGKQEARKQAKVKKKTPPKFVATKDPDAYVVYCQKKFWQALNPNIACEVTPDSYKELQFLSYEYQ